MSNESNAVLWAVSKNGSEIKIPILGICGEFESGKTMFALTIAPGKHTAGHPFAGLARTLVVDLEKSSENYAGSQLGFDRIDLPQQIMSNPAKIAYTSVDLYQEFRKVTLAIPDNRYDVMVIDPITDIDSGLTDYVKENPEKFGLTKAKIEKTSGLLWGVVKEEWNKLLLQLSTKCRTFAFTAHMRDVYVGNTPSGKREPKGKETLAKLATLYLELQRKPKGGIVPSVPTGIRLKSRICDTIFNQQTGEITTIELLPKVIENCTPQKIRSIIQNGDTNSTAFSEDHLSDDMRLAFKVELETKRAEANSAELELDERRKKLLAGMDIEVAVPPPPSKPSETLPKQQPQPTGKSKADVAISPPPPPALPVTENVPEPPAPVVEEKNPMWDGGAEFPPPEYNRETEIENIKTRFKEGYFTKDDLAEALKSYKVKKVSDLEDAALESMITHVALSKQIIDETVRRNIPRAKLEEFSQQAKEKSFFLSSIETKRKMLSVIESQPVPEGN